MMPLKKPEKMDLIVAFPNYMELWQKLDGEYQRTPEWRVIKRGRILHQMRQLTSMYTKWFEAWLKEHGAEKGVS